MAQKHILLVEDHPDDEELAMGALKKNNIMFEKDQKENIKEDQNKIQEEEEKPSIPSFSSFEEEAFNCGRYF